MLEEKLPSKIQKLVDSLVSSPFKLSHFQTNREITKIGIQFTYCMTNITWEFIFENETNCPDIILNDDTFIDLENIKSISKWNISSESSLLNLLEELFTKYKEIQLNRILSHPNKGIEFQISSVTSFTGAHFLIRNQDNQEHIVCSFPIKLDFTSIGDENLKEGKAAISITFKNNSSNNPSMGFELPKEYISYFPSEGFRFPGWDSQTNLFEFIPKSENYINQQIINPNLHLSFFESLSDLLGSPLEYDMKAKRISFVLNGTFPVVLIIDLDDNFPASPPTIVFQSFFHPMKGEIPYSTKLKKENIFWSTKWSQKEMASRIKDHMFEWLPKFKDHCVERW